MGGFGNIVEVDEMFVGNDKNKKRDRDTAHKYKVLSLVDRATGQASFVEKLKKIAAAKAKDETKK